MDYKMRIEELAEELAQRIYKKPLSDLHPDICDELYEQAMEEYTEEQFDLADVYRHDTNKLVPKIDK